jgi:selenocysteine lyase/cysteine desulfurase
MYSPRLVGRLGLLPDGVVRASLVHYNTADEIARFRSALVDVISSAEP